MGDNASDISKIAVILIAVAVLIGLVFGVFSIGKSIANDGVTKVQTNLDSVSSSEFKDYDEKVVTGTQVLAALDNFQGKSVAVLIATQADVNAYGDIDSDNKFVAPNKTGSADGPYVVAESGKTFLDADGSTTYTAGYLNYNAILGALDSSDSHTPATITFNDSCFTTKDAFAAKNGAVQYYSVTANINKSGMTEFVPTGAKFQANLLKDESGTNVGVVFRQIAVEYGA